MLNNKQILLYLENISNMLEDRGSKITIDFDKILKNKEFILFSDDDETLWIHLQSDDESFKKENFNARLN